MDGRHLQPRAVSLGSDQWSRVAQRLSVIGVRSTETGWCVLTTSGTARRP